MFILEIFNQSGSLDEKRKENSRTSPLASYGNQFRKRWYQNLWKSYYLGQFNIDVPYIVLYVDAVINLCDKFSTLHSYILQDHIASVKGSASSLHAPHNPDDFAWGEGVDFTSDADRPVKIYIITYFMQHTLCKQKKTTSIKWPEKRSLANNWKAREQENWVNQMTR